MIDDLILRELRKILRLSDWTIAERWHGVYAKHPALPVVEAKPLLRRAAGNRRWRGGNDDVLRPRRTSLAAMGVGRDQRVRESRPTNSRWCAGGRGGLVTLYYFKIGNSAVN